MPAVPYVEHHLSGSVVFTLHPRYVDVKPIGRGAYGLVASARDAGAGNRMVAVKKISNVFQDLTDGKRIVREVKLLRHFASTGVIHENIIGERERVCLSVPRPPL
jgi:serine/threonine protein kinase